MSDYRGIRLEGFHCIIVWWNIGSFAGLITLCKYDCKENSNIHSIILWILRNIRAIRSIQLYRHNHCIHTPPVHLYCAYHLTNATMYTLCLLFFVYLHAFMSLLLCVSHCIGFPVFFGHIIIIDICMICESCCFGSCTLYNKILSCIVIMIIVYTLLSTVISLW